MRLTVQWQQCRGFRLPLGRRWQLEVWHCPEGTVIPGHTHWWLDGWILCLWGRMRWRVGEKTRDVCGPVRLRRSGGIGLAAAPIPAGCPHAASVLGRRGVFLNLERRRLPGAFSAADDFHETV